MGQLPRVRSGIEWAARRAACRASVFALVTLWAALAPQTSLGQSVKLSTVLQWARESDAQYAAAQAAAASAGERLPQARSAARPNVNLTYGPRYNRERSTLAETPYDYMNGSAALVINQPIYRPANRLGIEQAEYQVQQANQQLTLAEQELLLRVATAYFDVLQAQDQLAAASGQLQAMAQQLAQSRKAFDVGTVPVTDVSESQARHDMAVAQEIAAVNELEAKKRVLEKIIARPMPSLAPLASAADVNLISVEEQQQLVAQSSSMALQVAINRSAVESARLEVSRRDTGHLPTLDLVASARNDRNNNFGRYGASNFQTLSGGVELAVPLYQGGLISSRVREAVADLDRAEKELLNAQRQARLDAQQAQLGVQSGSSLTRALGQALVSGEAQLRSVQRGLQVGVRTRVDVLNAEHQLYVTRRDLAASRYRTLISALQLRAAAGVLVEPDIRRLDALLEP